MNNESLVDLSKHPKFRTDHLSQKSLVLLPSQGEAGTNVLTGIEGEMLYEHRQEGQVVGIQGDGIFVSRVALPKAESVYREKLFGASRPRWMVPGGHQNGVPLDQIALADSGFMARLVSGVDSMSGTPVLYGFNETPQMQEIAGKLGIAYYGNSEFAGWAGTKSGLSEFARECGLQTPDEFVMTEPNQLLDYAKILKEKGYEQLVMKVDHSTGGMGHRKIRIDELLEKVGNGNWEGILPAEYRSDESVVVQGWIEGALSVSLATFVDFDGSTWFEGAQVHVIDKGEMAFGAVGATPIDEYHLNLLLGVGDKLAEGYVKYNAFGSHTMGMLVVPDDQAEKLGMPTGTVLLCDENCRPGASTISKAWILALREGRYGTGWVVSKIKALDGMKIGDVISRLDTANLLIRRPGWGASGIFVYNGAVLDSGYEQKFYAIAISGKDDYEEARQIMANAVGAFN